jgi:hypothetical protein
MTLKPNIRQGWRSISICPVAGRFIPKAWKPGLPLCALGCADYSGLTCWLRNRESVSPSQPLPGYITSLLPEIAQGSGISFEELVERILLSAALKIAG